MRKRLLALLSALVILCSINVQVLAVGPEQQQITFEEYYSAIQDRFECYGIRWEGDTINPYPDYAYTQEDLDEALTQVNEYCEKNLSSAQTAVVGTNAPETATISTGSSNEILPKSVMYYTYTMTKSTKVFDFSVPLIPREITIETTTDILTELLTYAIISVDEPELRVTGATGYDDYIRLVSYNYSVSKNNTTSAKATLNITCEVKESVTIGVVESWAYVTKDYTVSYTPLEGLD